MSKKPLPRIDACTCGIRDHETENWRDTNKIITCKKSGRKVWSGTWREAIEAWNAEKDGRNK